MNVARPPPDHLARRISVAVFAGLTLMSVAVGYRDYRLETEGILDEKHDTLAAIGELPEARYRATAVGLSVALCTVLSALLVGYVYRRRQIRLLAESYEAERRRVEALTTYRATLYSIGDGVITTDPEGHVREMNPVAERLTGWSEAEARGRPLAEVFHAINETTREPAVNSARTALREDRSVAAIAHSILTARDGTERPISGSVAPVHDASGRIVGLVLVISDQTGPHAAQRALKESEEKFRAIANSTVDWEVWWGMDAKPRWINPAVTRFTGYTEAECMAMPDLIGTVIHREDLPRVAPALQEALQGGRGEDLRVRGLRKDGSLWWIAISWGPLHDVHGALSGFRTSGRDVTKPVQAEEAREEALKRLQKIASRVPGVVYQFRLRPDGTSCLPYASEALRQIYRVAPENVREDASELFARHHPDDKDDVVAAILKSAQDLAPWQREYRLRFADGTVRWLFGDALPEREADGSTLWHGLITDITERKRSEESHARLATAVEQSAETIVITDTHGTILYVNPAFESSTGYTCAEVLGQNPRVLKSGRQDAEFYRQMWLTLERGEVWHGHFRNKRKDGTEYEEEATISPVRDGKGTIVSYVAVKRDVTRELELEAQFLQSQKMEAFGQLAGGVAHDFNNLLGVILGNAELLRMNFSAEEQRAFVQEIIEAGDRASNLTRQLLVFSRRQVMQLRPVDLNEIVSGMVKMLQRIIGEDISLQTQLGPGPAPVQADPGMLEQVVLNLAVNARDAMPDGGQLRLAVESITLDEEAAALRCPGRPRDFIRLRVQDTGIGMAPEVLLHAFEPFFTTKDVGKGTGLGLATVHGILAQHDGWAEVSSEPGRGSTFHVYLPRLADGRQLNTEDAAAAPRVRGGSETILLVEDELTLRVLSTRVLERYGYRVIPADNGVAALELWQEHGRAADLLLTDLVMPKGVSGLQLAERLQADKPGLKVLFMSGYSGEVAGRGVDLREGANFLRKPFDPARLAQTVRGCLDTPLEGAGGAGQQFSS